MATALSSRSGSTPATTHRTLASGPELPPPPEIMPRGDRRRLEACLSHARKLAALLMQRGTRGELLAVGLSLAEELAQWHRRTVPGRYGRGMGSRP